MLEEGTRIRDTLHFSAQDDADTIAPSLYAGRGGRKRTEANGDAGKGGGTVTPPEPAGGTFVD